MFKKCSNSSGYLLKSVYLYQRKTNRIFTTFKSKCEIKTTLHSYTKRILSIKERSFILGGELILVAFMEAACCFPHQTHNANNNFRN